VFAELHLFYLQLKGEGMKRKLSSTNPESNCPESEQITEKYHSVEMKPVASLPIYQFKLYRCSDMNGVSVHVKQDSEVLNHLRPGEKVDMKYYPKDSDHQISYMKTKILNIIKEEQGPFKGHFQIGLSIVD
jgi:hypothetical protein